MKALRLTALALVLFIPARAQPAAPADLRPWAEAPLPTTTLAAQELEREFAARYAPPAASAAGAGGAVSEEARKSLLEQYDKAIKQMEDTLAKLKQDDPQRALLLTTLDAMRKARDNFANAAAAPAAPQAPAPKPTPKASAPVTLAAALANSRALLDARAGSKALTALRALPELKTARGAQAVAAASALAGEPLAALAALLAAHEAEPGNPAHLVNAAGLLSLLGFGWEALALLDAADALKAPYPAALDLNGKAIALNNRGHALLAVGKAAEAEAVLRQAAALEPLLSEARSNLAMALRAQGKTEEAVRYYLAGKRRAPGSEAQAPAANQPQAAAQPSATRPRPAAELYDLSHAKSGHLPTIHYGKTAREHESLVPKLERMVAALDERVLARNKRLVELQNQRRIAPGPGGQLSAVRVADIVGRLSIVGMAGEPSLAGSWSDVLEAFDYNHGEVNFANRFVAGTGGADVQPKLDLQTARGRYEDALAPTGPQQSREEEACGNGLGASACREAVNRKYDNIRCDLSEKAYQEWRTSMLRLDGAVADHFTRAYRFMTALAANISDPVDHALALDDIEAYSDYVLRFYVLLPAITPKFSPVFSYVHLCKPAGAAQEPGEADLPAAARCELNVSGPNKISLNLVVAEVSFNCEKVALEVTKGEILEAFLEVEYEFTGKLTVAAGAGVGVEAGPVDVSVKGGCYVTVDTATGNFVDAGLKGSAGATTSGGVGASSELEGSISFIAG